MVGNGKGRTAGLAEGEKVQGCTEKWKPKVGETQGKNREDAKGQAPINRFRVSYPTISIIGG